MTANFSYFCLELKAFATNLARAGFFYIATRNEKFEITMMKVKLKFILGVILGKPRFRSKIYYTCNADFISNALSTINFEA